MQLKYFSPSSGYVLIQKIAGRKYQSGKDLCVGTIYKAHEASKYGAGDTVAYDDEWRYEIRLGDKKYELIDEKDIRGGVLLDE